MKYKTVNDFFPQNLESLAKNVRTRVYSLRNAEWRRLEDDTYVDGITYAKGSEYKVFETTNFGWVVFKPESKSPCGATPNKFIHKF